MDGRNELLNFEMPQVLIIFKHIGLNYLFMIRKSG